MNKKMIDDLFYVCSIIEYIARITHNRRCNVTKCLSERDLKRQLRIAEMNHCLSFEQVADEWIEEYKIADGAEKYDYKYQIPTVQSIGRVYQMLITSTCPDENIAYWIKVVFESFISDEISDFNSNVYYSNPDYLRCSFLEGRMLA